jgi:protein-disulfide isomerase
VSKIWIALGVLLVAVGVGAAAFLGVFDRAPPATTAAGPAGAQRAAAVDPEIAPDDRILGQPDAPVTIIEYASLTCPHCASFHKETLPQLKSEFIDTGKVKMVFRDFPLDKMALSAAGLARCMPAERYFPFLSVLFGAQASWATAADPIAALARIGKTGGLSEEEVARCTSADAHLDTVVAQRLEGEKRYQIRSTPSFVIGGKTYGGALTIDELREILKPLVP